MGLELAAAFLAGIVSFISPCIIPMIMVYLTTITGFAFDALIMSGKNPLIRKALVAKTLVFVLSFTLVFTAAGAAAAVLGKALPDFFSAMSIIAGIMFLLLAIYYVGLLKGIAWRIGGMMDEGRVKKFAEGWKGSDGGLSYAGVFMVGLLFALVCSHCISPTLFPALVLASSANDAFSGGAVMLAFSLGLGLSFLLASLFFSQTVCRLEWIARNRRVVNFAVGAMFIAFGILLLTGQYLSFVSVLYRIVPWQGAGM